MGNTCSGNSGPSLMKFADKNIYQPRNDSNFTLENENIVKVLAPKSKNPKDYKLLTNYILQNEKHIFFDKHFEQLYLQNKKTKKPLDILYDYQRLKIKKLYETSDTHEDNFKQYNLELTYLASVFYFICKHKQMKEQIFVTKEVNNYHAYIINLHCNGKPCEVIIDDYIPTEGSKIENLNIEKGTQLWPILLEKAWCKQIGSYDEAVGLSPEDCFQQITGIPAHSSNLFKEFSILDKIFSEALESGCWIVLTAKLIPQNQMLEMSSRQVYWLHSINKNNSNKKTYTLKSPYKVKHQPNPRYSRNRQLQQSRQVQQSRRRINDNFEIKTLEEIYSQFQFYTIGYYKSDFETLQCQFIARKMENVIYDLEIFKQDTEINIRLIQFYEGYISSIEKQYYEYSPVIMELYNKEKQLVYDAQNFTKGKRASSLSNKENIFLQLRKGKYYLRVQVDWYNEELINEAVLALYGEKECFKIQRSNHKQNFYLKLIGKSLQEEKSGKVKKMEGNNNKLQVKFLEKSFSYVLGIRNLDEKNTANLKVVFKQVKNLMINHQKYRFNKLEIDNIRIPSEHEEVFEIIPQNYNQSIQLKQLTIIKY